MSKRLKIFTIINISLLVILAGLVMYISFQDQSKSEGAQDKDIVTAFPSPTAPSEEVSSPANQTPSSDSDVAVTITPANNEGNDVTDTTPETDTRVSDPNKTIVLTFAGDVNFSEDSRTIARYDQEGKGMLGVMSPELIEEMTEADITMLNNEFPYSVRGSKTPNKSYTFRADPKRIELLHEMGVDIVSLANNHALDFGQDALLDTFTHLEENEIDYIGAGINIDRAKQTIYYTIGDTTIAYLAASRVIFAGDWYATDTRPGMIGIYDPTLFIECIEDAVAHADYVVTYLHWGVERENYPVDYQKKMAKQFIDAGADLVIGCHPHVLQGFEFYKGKPIAYSLGNYWFNASTNKTGLLKLYLDPDQSIRLQMIPAAYSNAYTSIITNSEEKSSYFDFLREISFQVNIDEDGFITDASSN